MADSGALLKRACDLVLDDPLLKPQDAKGRRVGDAGYDGHIARTHCNQAVRLIAQALGCHEFDDPEATADVMCAIMALNVSGRWKVVDGTTATIHALEGGLAVAAMDSSRLAEAHGHVAVVYPIGTRRSESLGHDVPLLANVGKTVGVMKSSEAFPVAKGEASYFTWTGA